MMNWQEFDGRARVIEELVGKLETAANPAFRATARELVQALMELHRVGLERALELVDEIGPPGAALIDRLAGDGIVKHLLVLHGLHPLDLATRVHQAIAGVRSAIEASGGEVAHVSVDDTGRVAIAIRVESGKAQGCGSPGAGLKTIVEDAIYDTAPDVTSLTVEVAAETAPIFIPIGSLRRRGADDPVAPPGRERSVACP